MKKNDFTCLKQNCLFRYRPITKRNLQAFRMNRLYFSNPVFFNDDYDTRMYFNLDTIIERAKDAIDNNMDDYLGNVESYDPIFSLLLRLQYDINHNDSIFMDEYYKKTAKELKEIPELFLKETKVICFSEDYKSEKMWAYYADSMKGMCLAYNKKDIEEAIGFSKNGEKVIEKLLLKKVDYTEERIDMTDYLESLYLHYSSMDIPFPIKYYDVIKPPIDQLEKMISTKSLKWQHEKEWRLFSLNDNYASDSNLAFLKIKPAAIILGTKTTDKNKKNIIRFAKRKRIHVFQMQISNQKNYELECDLIY